MTEQQIEKLYELMTKTTELARENIRSLYLGSIGEDNIPFCFKYYRSSKNASVRGDMVKFVIRYSRESELARKLGIEALQDRSNKVRRNGCAVLAYSLRQDMIPYLEVLFESNDELTREKARSAVDAIHQGDIDYFVAPVYNRWTVSQDRVDMPTDDEIDFYVKKNMPSLVKPLEAILGTIYPAKVC